MVQDNYRKIKLLKLLELLRKDSDEQNPITTSVLCGRLEEMGINEGDTVSIYNLDFEYVT